MKRKAGKSAIEQAAEKLAQIIEKSLQQFPRAERLRRLDKINARLMNLPPVRERASKRRRTQENRPSLRRRAVR